jgi:hypothetical protein
MCRLSACPCIDIGSLVGSTPELPSKIGSETPLHPRDSAWQAKRNRKWIGRRLR